MINHGEFSSSPDLDDQQWIFWRVPLLVQTLTPGFCPGTLRFTICFFMSLFGDGNDVGIVFSNVLYVSLQ